MSFRTQFYLLQERGLKAKAIDTSFADLHDEIRKICSPNSEEEKTNLSDCEADFNDLCRFRF